QRRVAVLLAAGGGRGDARRDKPDCRATVRRTGGGTDVAAVHRVSHAFAAQCGVQAARSRVAPPSRGVPALVRDAAARCAASKTTGAATVRSQGGCRRRILLENPRATHPTNQHYPQSVTA